MKKVLAGLLLLSILNSFSVKAQDSQSLSLQEAIDRALENNKEIVIAGLEEESARANFRQTQAVFLPQIKLSYTAMTTNNPLNAFGFKLQQQSISPTDFNPEVLNAPAATQNYMTKAEWLQPILNMDMLYMRRAASQQIDVYAFKTKRTKEYLNYEVKQAYAQLQLAYQARRVIEESLSTIQSIYEATANRQAKGFLQKSDVLNVQVQVTATQSQLAEAKSNVQNASDYLSLLMGTQTGVLYEVDELTKVQSIESSTVEVPVNRADFLAMQSAVSATDKMISSGKLSYLPKVNGFAQYLINDKEVFGFGSDSYLVGAQLSWSLFNGMATQNKIAQHRIERNKLEEQLSYKKSQSQLELNKTVRHLYDLHYALQQHELAVQQAEESLRILQNRYQQGLVATNDLLQAQTVLAQQKLNQAQAFFQFNTTQAYLQFLTATPEK